MLINGSSTITYTVASGTVRLGAFIVGTGIVNGSIIQSVSMVGTVATIVVNNVQSQSITVAASTFQYNTFASPNSGWYLINYKFDVRVGYTSPQTGNCRGAAALTLNGFQVVGSGAVSQAPNDNEHQYTISNAVLVNYTGGQQLGLQWWSGTYSNDSSASLNTSVAGLSIGPNPSPTEWPWIPAQLSTGAGNVTTTINMVLTTITTAAALPQATIHVVSTTGFTPPAAGTIYVTSSTGLQTITFTGTTGTTFTGCTGGTGNIVVGNSVTNFDNSLPATVIPVTSTTGFATTGTIYLVTSGDLQAVQYTGVGTAANGTPIFTGATGGTGIFYDNMTVSNTATGVFDEATATMIITRIVNTNI